MLYHKPVGELDAVGPGDVGQSVVPGSGVVVGHTGQLVVGELLATVDVLNIVLGDELAAADVLGEELAAVEVLGEELAAVEVEGMMEACPPSKMTVTVAILLLN